MKLIDDLHKAYLEVDSYLSLKESRAASQKSRDLWGKRRDRNEQAYFMVIFARFESLINDLCVALIDRKKTGSRWADRRVWQTIDTDRDNIRRFPFMKRVTLLIENTSTDYQSVKRYYDLRCSIAHGSSVGPISVTVVAVDLIRLMKVMGKHA
jgi:hypothetical protein